jgi:transposase
MTHQLFLDLPGFSIQQVSIAGDLITIVAQSQVTSVICPKCAHASSRVHSRYSRQLADLPWSGRRVRLILQVHRFFCTWITCPRKTFAEAIPEVAKRYARRTTRLNDVLTLLGIAVGAEPAARLTMPLGITCSSDTLLRCVHRVRLEPPQPPRVVGIDDWSWRKGHTYGTIICDLERHCPIDLLADRSADSVEAWFKAHPSVEIISRDRGTTYAEGARKGAPQAHQVADRWHLLGNLEEALEDQLAPYLTTDRQSKTQEQPRPEGPAPLVPREPRRSQKQERAREVHRQERLAQYEQVVLLVERGLTQGEIARQVGVNVRTVQRWLAAGAFPERKPRQQASQLDAYQSFIHQRWSQGCHNVARIYQELCSQKCKCDNSVS